MPRLRGVDLLYRETESFRRVKQVDGKSLLIDPGKLESIFWMPSNKGQYIFRMMILGMALCMALYGTDIYIYIYTHTHF